MERKNYEVKTEIMRKERFETLREKFTNIDETAKETIAAAKPSDILAITLSIDNPVNVTEAVVITADEFIQQAFLTEE